MAKRAPIVTIEVGKIDVDIKATRNALRQLGREYRSAFDKELKAAVAPIVADAKRRYRVLHPRRKRKGRRARGSQRAIRAGSVRSQPAVFLNGDKYPWMPGQEWGSNRYPFFPARRPAASGRGSEGYFWWPAIEDGRDAAQKKIISAVDAANAKAFPDS